ncbi:YheC/YheD family protein [Alicyclobacillus fastidiosus]|uniref:YheC/YheD family protein n=1 Tax=Alicyclobacillus fastidiosus TaxID=392011 RepID=A0ABV5AE42_9BACL|nr:YheC/YheD family protein [Alicyclobacillus fastidiosus]WEH09896.1 YheC/YheD family protein [Alicyclobacillus fastidiosus]
MTRGQIDLSRMYLDKWQMHLALSHDIVQGLKLPFTQLLSQCMTNDFTKYNAWYVKPINTWGGHQIAKCERSGEQAWILRQQTGPVQRYRHIAQLVQDLTLMYDPIATIVQQAAPVATWRNRPFDIRVLCQRESDCWVFAGSLARVAAQGSLVSNLGTGHGDVFPTREVLEVLYPKRSKQSRVLQHLKQYSLRICEILDSYAQFDEVGVDYGLSHEGQIWLFEVNTNDRLGGPSRELFAKLPDKTTYEQIEARAEANRQAWLSQLVSEILSVD